MFNKKFVLNLCKIVGFMIMAQVLLMITMFVWSYFGTPPVQIFDARISGVVKYLLLLQEIGSSLFFYVAIAGVKYLMHCHDCLMPARKPTMSMPTSAPNSLNHSAPKKRIASRANGKASMGK